MTKGIGKLMLACAALVALGSAGDARAAQYLTHNYSIAGVAGQSATPDTSYTQASVAPLTTSSNATFGLFGVVAESATWAQAVTGAVRASAVATGSSAGTECCTFAGGGGTAYAWAEYQDVMVLNAAGVLVGTPGTVTVRFDTTGAAAPKAEGQGSSASAGWRSYAWVGSEVASEGYFAVKTGASGVVVLENGGFGPSFLTFNVVYGQPIAVRLRVEASGQATVPLAFAADASGVSNLSNTFVWSGIQSATAGGTTLRSFTATSPDTGFDFKAGFNAVPEPGTWAVMILGFGLTGAALRRRTAALA